MRDPMANSGRVIAGAALRGAERVLASSSRLIADPVGGFAETGGLVAEGSTPFSGQITEQDFLQALGSAIVDRLGLVGQGDERRPGIEAALGVTASSIFKTLSGGASWQATLERFLGADQDRSPEGVQAAIDQLVDILDPAPFLDLARRIQALPEGEKDFIGRDPASAGEEAELLRLISGVIPPAIWQQVVGGPAYQAAQEIQQAVLPNAVPSSIRDGILVHTWVQMHYRNDNTGLLLMERVLFGPQGNRIGRLGELVKDANAGAIVRTAFNAFISMGANQFLGYVKPDILDFARRELYEIKPRSQAVLGVAQMQMYVFWWGLASQNVLDLPILPGSAYVPPRVVPATKGRIAVVQRDPRVPGLIFYDIYECSNCKKLQEIIEAPSTLSPEALAALIVLAIVAAIAVGILVGAGVYAAGVVGGAGVAATEGGIIAVLARLMQQALQQSGRFALP